MARNTVTVVGDSSSLTLRSTNITAVDPVVFLSGSFRGSPEERRVCSVFVSLEAGTKTAELRFEFTDPHFVEHTVTGKPVYPRAPDTLEATS